MNINNSITNTYIVTCILRFGETLVNWKQEEQLDKLVEVTALMALYIEDTTRPDIKKNARNKLMLSAFPEKIKNDLSDIFEKYIKEVEE